MKPSTYCLRRTAIAAVRASDGEKTFFQDFDGQIRETRYEDTRGYSGGDKRSVIGAATHAKYQSPLAAVSTEEDRKAVTLFYISKTHRLCGITFSSHTSRWSPDTALADLDVPACPSSQLAATCFDTGSEIRLFYQDPTLTLRELAFDGHCWDHVADFRLPALVGSGMASEKWLNDDGTLREIQFVYQDEKCAVRSHFYLADEDKWYQGYLNLADRPPQCGLAIAAHRNLGYGADVCRVYVVEHGGKIVEHAFYSDTEEWKVEELAPRLLVESKLAACWWPSRGNPEIRLFYQGVGGELEGFNFQNRRWWLEHALPCGDDVRGRAKL
ncbi:MAG: hypothetical protein HETSPECPRED_005689 [Heterodermia speciosa]|uniref:Fucose-specific lectin n=1 Tax=Heterodermia speciosa TaxID=116794 RepID=A0A8H3IEA9_9LECA|nr:MAG: hypothetical protein HETSPECPRED_005689 [Heterodermia speciosa]